MKLLRKLKKYSLEERTILFTKYSSLYNFISSLVKLVIGIIKQTYYFFSIGLFGLLIGYAKRKCWKELNGNTDDIRKLCLRTGTIIIVFGVIYAVFMIRLLYIPHEVSYSMIAGVMIATMSFTSLTLSIVGIVRTRGKSPIIRTIKLINLATALTDISLTQVALTSFSTTNLVQNYNSYFGILVGVMCCLIGVYIIYQVTIQNKITHDL